MSDSLGNERRRFSRFPVEGRVRLYSGSQMWSTTLIDMSLRGVLVERPADAFAFGYRKCELRGHDGWFLVCAVTLELARGDKESIRSRMREIYQRKQQSQPVTAWSAGCVFKNPAPDAPAGRLIEEAGLRGTRLGGMAFSPVHANFLVNEGGGTFEQAMELIELAREKVRARSGHELELEVRLWP